MAVVEKRFAIGLDIKSPIPNREIEVVEGDNGNVFDVALTDNGNPIDLTGCKVIAVFAKPDGKTAQQDNDGNGIEMSVDAKNEFSISLYNTSFSPGEVNCEVQVFSGEGFEFLVTSALFNFTCRRGIANADTIVSTDEWPLLTGLIRDVQGLEQSLEGLIPEAQTATQEANAAAENANEAAGRADGVLSEAQAATQLANTAANAAGTAAEEALAAGQNAQEAADRANEAAQNAEDVLGGALPKHAHTHAKGGSDEITLEMLGAADAQTVAQLKDDIANKAEKTISTAVTLLADGWTADTPYTQTVSIAHLTGDRFENPDVFPEFTENIEEEREAWNLVDQVVSVEGALEFTCFTEAPAMDLTLIVKASQRSRGSDGIASFNTDETLYFTNGVLGVNTSTAVEADNTLPITSAAVASTVGNIEILLKTI